MGPLSGLNVIEMAGIGPAPFVGMMLSDMGADVLRLDRKSAGASDSFDRVKAPNFVDRGRRSARLDLKTPEGAALALDLIAGADAVIEGFRPGVMERLGLGPDVCLARNPKLVYGRVTGWGQHGPLSQTAGHDINYVALTGVLHAIGGAERPLPPLNIIGDFAGGAMMLAFGVVCALLEAKTSGRGQVVDAAMTDGAATLSAMIYSFHAAGQWRDARAANLLDGGAPFYRAYACADDKFVAVGALEPQFFAALLKGLDIAESELPDRWDTGNWPAIAARFEAVFKTRPRDAWAEIFAPDRRLRDADPVARRGPGASAQCRARGVCRRRARDRAALLAHARRHRRAASHCGRGRRGGAGRARRDGGAPRGSEGERGHLDPQRRAQPPAQHRQRYAFERLRTERILGQERMCAGAEGDAANVGLVEIGQHDAGGAITRDHIVDEGDRRLRAQPIFEVNDIEPALHQQEFRLFERAAGGDADFELL